MRKPKAWSCPYCNRACTIGEQDEHEFYQSKELPEVGNVYAWTSIIVCPNPTCRQLTVSFRLRDNALQTVKLSGQELSWQLVPESEAKRFPDYIPKQLRDDYAEACLIRHKSPKASATLSRRCLQGIIRDFWGITKHRLVDEIDALREKVDPTTWKAIDSVRHVGNIGAHMEKDVNLIIDVDPDEAGLLIWLMETLFAEWYIARHDREQRMTALARVADSKVQAAKPDAAPSPSPKLPS